MKEWLKVGDKNKLGERRKLIIHNRQFTRMSTAETEKLRLLPLKKRKPFSALPPMWSYLFGYIVKGGMQQEVVERRSRHQTIRTWLSFQILHTSAHFMPPL